MHVSSLGKLSTKATDFVYLQPSNELKELSCVLSVFSSHPAIRLKIIVAIKTNIALIFFIINILFKNLELKINKTLGTILKLLHINILEYIGTNDLLSII